MKTTYRDHVIEATRERSYGGDILLYYSVFRLSDGLECTSGFTTGTETIHEYIRLMKARVDDELASDDPWCEEEVLML